MRRAAYYLEITELTNVAMTTDTISRHIFVYKLHVFSHKVAIHVCSSAISMVLKKSCDLRLCQEYNYQVAYVNTQ